jgi:ATP adenylyltransferase/5',5'''-P-1,P-4-tetraphosphate phosphorylase II
VLITSRELQGHGAGAGLASRVHALLEQQRKSWEMLRTGYDSLRSVQTRDFQLDGVSVTVQYNPGRMTSSSARVDEHSIRNRKCFLCPAHLPQQQRGILYEERWLILCNPFPIFPEHFTVVHVDHTPQRILGSFEAMLRLSRDLAEGYTVFYNGPRCGASAPDHMHFQAGSRRFMPLESQYAVLRQARGKEAFRGPGVRVVGVGEFLRPFIAMEGEDAGRILDAFQRLAAALAANGDEAEEPMMNILAFYEEGWRVLLFPRRKHRPSFYDEEGERKILVSPAAVDLAGVCILPRDEDFRKIRLQDLETMFREVCVSPADIARLLTAW